MPALPRDGFTRIHVEISDRDRSFVGHVHVRASWCAPQQGAGTGHPHDTRRVAEPRSVGRYVAVGGVQLPPFRLDAARRTLRPIRTRLEHQVGWRADWWGHAWIGSGR